MDTTLILKAAYGFCVFLMIVSLVVWAPRGCGVPGPSADPVQKQGPGVRGPSRGGSVYVFLGGK